MLSVNAMVSSPESLEIWRDRDQGRRHYLPDRISLSSLPDGGLAVSEGETGVTYEVRVSQSNHYRADASSLWWCRSRSHRRILLIFWSS